ncbi:uncharacterized protein N7518_004646 [Penicillium psychrosexuale]|uniref:uncharacterized protein n=1 Tax=Penicillium psychrosexuale TaxID=1002107 RepID=UPI002545297E|nr:uncharacterized protein N7518_004646 [Penicillium psychrosexuale]KAJ5796106.1 hypothetical protein N7518_004646 [Penicillium psychrosexuale]
MDVKYHVNIEYSIPGSFIILPMSGNIEQRRSPPPKLTPLSLFPAFPFSPPKHPDNICFCRFISSFFKKLVLDFSWSGDQSSSNCEDSPLERLCGA